jgi:hypothetical protein
MRIIKIVFVEAEFHFNQIEIKIEIETLKWAETIQPLMRISSDEFAK